MREEPGQSGLRMSSEPEVVRHYAKGGLLERLEEALAQDGVDPKHPSIETLAPYDQFHGRGLEATREVAELLQVAAADHLLDIGSGIGGPARYMAQRFGCRVTGIDLTEPFCEIARELTRRVGLQHRVEFHTGDALAIPFADGCFDGAYSMNVSMNIADKAAFYREIRRVLKPGGWLMLSEVAKGPGADLEYPTPWAMSSGTSFLATPGETRHGLEEAGFEVLLQRDTAAQAAAFGARSRELVARGEKPPHRAVQLIHGELAPRAMANTALGLAEARIVPIEVLARKRR